jgi:hypothetical protein
MITAVDTKIEFSISRSIFEQAHGKQITLPRSLEFRFFEKLRQSLNYFEAAFTATLIQLKAGQIVAEGFYIIEIVINDLR